MTMDVESKMNGDGLGGEGKEEEHEKSNYCIICRFLINLQKNNLNEAPNEVFRICAYCCRDICADCATFIGELYPFVCSTNCSDKISSRKEEEAEEEAEAAEDIKTK